MKLLGRSVQKDAEGAVKLVPEEGTLDYTLTPVHAHRAIRGFSHVT